MIRRHPMPFGAEVQDDGSVRFALWAPKADRVDLWLSWGDGPETNSSKDISLGMNREDGWFSLLTDTAAAGARYKFQIDGGMKVPDPASRFQPADVHGPSLVVNPRTFDWKEDALWLGRPWDEAVLYELHVGTFTSEGTFAAIEKRLDYLADLGVTAVELMPVGDFPGSRNWGYDGVFQFAPDSCYGQPDELKHLVQAAHSKGLMIFLDVVYNHFGPEGNYLREYAPQFFTSAHHTPWGDGINFDGEDSRPVRDFFIHNALYWLQEYHFDGLRLDAVHAIADDSNPSFLTELAQAVRRTVAPGRQIHLVLENDENDARYLKRNSQAIPELYDAQWNDDIHHALHAAITGEKDGYYADYADQPLRHVGRCLTEGFDYQGQPSPFHEGAIRGEPSRDLPPGAFVSFLQNHDQVGNRAFGERIAKLAIADAVRAATTILLLAPAPPMLFMGEEFSSGSPFLFFCDFAGDLAQAVTAGRRDEFARFARFQDPQAREQIPNPNAPSTFQDSKLCWKQLEQPESQSWLAFFRELLQIRRCKIVPRLRKFAGGKADFELLGSSGLAVRWTLSSDSKLSLLANLGERVVSGINPPQGELLYSSVESLPGMLDKGRLPAWSAAWFLQ